jgi:hypothetical protein
MSSLKDILTKGAPILGTALGGPLGGAVVGILAELFNTDPNEAAVTAAMNSSDPNVIAANLARAEAAFKAAAEESITLRQQITSHVEMMRLDYDRGGFYSLWRPFAGWIATLYAAATCVIVLRDAWYGTYLFLAQAPNMLMVGGPIMAIAGIYAFGKSQERAALANAPAGAGLGSVVRELVGRVSR